MEVLLSILLLTIFILALGAVYEVGFSNVIPKG